MVMYEAELILMSYFKELIDGLHGRVPPEGIDDESLSIVNNQVQWATFLQCPN